MAGALKRAIRWQPLAEAENRSVGVAIDSYAIRGRHRCCGRIMPLSGVVEIPQHRDLNLRDFQRRLDPDQLVSVVR